MAAAQTPEISIRYVPLDKVAGWPRNPKQHDFETLIDSLRRFGFTQPLVFDETTERIVAGHGRLEALLRMRAARMPRPKRIGVDSSGAWTVPVLTGISFASEQEAESYLVADNRVSELGGWNQAELDAMLRELDDLSGVGFDLPEPDFGSLPEPELEPEDEDDSPESRWADPPRPQLHSQPRTTATGPIPQAWADPPSPVKAKPSVPAQAGSSRVGYTLGNVDNLPAPPAAPAAAQPRAETPAPAPAAPVPWKQVVQPDAPAHDVPRPPPVLPDAEISDSPVGGVPKPNVIIQYTLIFDDTDQRDRFVGLLRDLKAKYPESETVAERFDLWLREVRGEKAAAA